MSDFTFISPTLLLLTISIAMASLRSMTAPTVDHFNYYGVIEINDSARNAKQDRQLRPSARFELLAITAPSSLS